MNPSPCDTTFSTPANVRPTLNPAVLGDLMSSPSITAADQQRRSFVLRMDQALRKQRESAEQQSAEQTDHLTTPAGDNMFVPNNLEKGTSKPASLGLRSYRSPSSQISFAVCAKESMATPPQRGDSAQYSCVHQDLAMNSPYNRFVHLEGAEELADSPLDRSIDYSDIMEDDDGRIGRIQLRPKMHRHYPNVASPMHSIVSSSWVGGAPLVSTLAPPPSLAPRSASGGFVRPSLAPVFPLMTPENSQSTIDAPLVGPLDIPMLAFTPQNPPNFGGI